MLSLMFPNALDSAKEGCLCLYIVYLCVQKQETRQEKKCTNLLTMRVTGRKDDEQMVGLICFG